MAYASRETKVLCDKFDKSHCIWRSNACSTMKQTPEWSSGKVAASGATDLRINSLPTPTFPRKKMADLVGNAN